MGDSMDLQEEYFVRREVKSHLIKHVERGVLLLKARPDCSGKKPEHNLVQLNITSQSDANHPNWYRFQMFADPIIVTNQDFSQLSMQPQKAILEYKWEWDQYEDSLLAWSAEHSGRYIAIPSAEAIFISWLMFCTHYDSWISSFMPWRVIDVLEMTLIGERDDKLKHIAQVETWIREKHERVFNCWKNVKNNFEQKNYVDWFAKVVNEMGGGQ
jgi:hypothetical protein